MYRSQESHGPLVVVTLGVAIVAMDRATGRRVWQHKGEGFIGYGKLTVTADLVIAGGGKAITALTYTSGTHVYTVEAPFHVDTWLYDAGQLFVAGQGEVASFDGATGRLLWHDGFSGYGHHSAALGLPGSAVSVDRRG